MTQKQITITVYSKNRHMRCSQANLNDIKGGQYISQRALRALFKAGISFKFVRMDRTYSDVTAVYQELLNSPTYAMREFKPRKRNSGGDGFDPFQRRT